jgi:predicted Rossmann-fold nucleotide-binding protein
MKTINELKQQSERKAFASVLGKSTINAESEEYNVIQEITKVLFRNGYGVIHGGYAGGAMQAVSDTAQEIIDQENLSPYCNIAVPQVQHDGLWDRVIKAHFTDASLDIFDRLKIVTSGDIAVICPLGGDGTELEETIVFHENIVKMGMNKYGGHDFSMTPLIFIQTPNGTNWKRLIHEKMNILDVSVRDIKEYEWLHFVNSVEEFENTLKKYTLDSC